MTLGITTMYLDTLEDSELDEILSYTQDELDIYLDALIEHFYPYAVPAEITPLKTAYKSSFALESFYRSTDLLYQGFTCLYTKTGLIKEMVNDLYEIPPAKIILH